MRQCVCLQLRGFSIASDAAHSAFFAPALDVNAAAVAAVYTSVEGALFGGLRKLLTKFAPWAALATVNDLGASIAAQVPSLDDVEAAFEALRAAARELGTAVPDEVAEGCFAVSLVPLKRAVGADLCAARDALVTALRSSAEAVRDTVAAFARDARAALEAPAASMSEIGAARVEVHPRSSLCVVLPIDM